MERPPQYPGVRKGSREHIRNCTTECLKEYMECVKKMEKQEQQELEFNNIDSALSWLREHKTEVAVGTIGVVAGVAFVVATAGAGALVLTPLAL
jgi:hypothetical protein